jgi:hypothetical protein
MSVREIALVHFAVSPSVFSFTVLSAIPKGSLIVAGVRVDL